MNRIVKIGYLFFLYACFEDVYAETQWYRVEVLVFAQNIRSSEIFDQTSSRIEWPGNLTELAGTALPLADLKQAPQAYAPLQSVDWTLTAAHQTLQLQGGYRPLLHTAWVQPLDAGLTGAAVHIRAGGKAEEGGVLDGLVQIESSDQLYLLADLEYAPVAQGAETIVYRLREKRRLQLDEVHYLDHPKFGAICKVSLLQ